MLACSPDEGGKCVVSAPFDFGVRLGLVFVVQAASLSAITVSGLLAYIAYTSSVSRIKTNAARKWTTATHVHWYFLSLLVSEVIQAIGGIIDARWIADAMVTEGHTCTAQGVLKQAGDVGAALASLAIALHTFFALVFRWRPSANNRMPIFVITGIWLFLILLVGISLGTHKGKDYYGDTQFWCWITEQYPVQRVVLEYMWMWITAFLNFVLYTLIAFVLFTDRTAVASGWRIRFIKNAETGLPVPGWEKRLALKMLVYPATYTITVLPIAVTRWRGFTGHQVPWAATVFSDVVFASSGYLNVILFTLTRPRLLPSRQSREHSFSTTNSRVISSPPLSPNSMYHDRGSSQVSNTVGDTRHSASFTSTTLPMNSLKLLREDEESQITNGLPQESSPLPPGI
ncbi:hypothetical protein BC629DRAFT_1588573 [Irpex lacteus]|nr:hypothetical protein BC629DRAFT_1588573 [Irpex lacteus]